MMTFEEGKKPPTAIDIEEALLGSMLQDPSATEEVLGQYPNPEIFYKPAHQKVFSVIKELHSERQLADILTVTTRCTDKGLIEEVGGPFAIADLTNKAIGGTRAMNYAAIVHEKWYRREIGNICQEIGAAVYGQGDGEYTETGDLEQELLTRVEALSSGMNTKEMLRVGDMLAAAVDNIDDIRNNDEGITGVTSGIPNIDKVSGGWQKTDLIIIAARPGQGKTSLVLTAARNAAVAKIPTAIFSLEMGKEQLVKKLIAAEAEVNTMRLTRGLIDDKDFLRITTSLDNLKSAPLFIDDTPAINILQLKAKLRKAIRKYGIQLAIVDYLQLMRGVTNRGNREQEISSITRGLKELAKELDIPIIALSQLSRAVEQRGGFKKPQLSDLRESGAIEQDADMVAFLWRAAYYGFTEDEDGNSISEGYTEFIVAKYRSGKLGTEPLKFHAAYTKFTNMEEEYSDFKQAKPIDTPHPETEPPF